MTKRTKLWLPVVLILASSLGALVIVASKPDVKTEQPVAAPKTVSVMEVVPQPVQIMVSSQGTVTPRTESVLVSQVPGLVQEVSPNFVTGGFFEKDDRLVVLDQRDYQYTLVQAHSQLARAELALKIEQEQGQIAIEEWQRLNDQAAPPLVARQPQLLEAQATLESAKASVAQAQLNLERATIRAPFDGRVRAKNVDIGQYVTTGMTLATIYAIEYAEVRLPLPDHELAFLDIPFDFRNSKSSDKGPQVTLRARFAGRDQDWVGYISRIEAEVDARSRMIHAVVRVENPYGGGSNGTQTPLAVGLFVEAEIAGKTFEDVVVVPRKVLRDDGTVLIVDREDRLRFREVEVLRLETESVYITSGLYSDERICLSVLDAVVAGMHVRPAQQRAATPRTK